MKIADFGSAKEKSVLAQTFIGTPAYMAPEMLRQDEGQVRTVTARVFVCRCELCLCVCVCEGGVCPCARTCVFPMCFAKLF